MRTDKGRKVFCNFYPQSFCDAFLTYAQISCGDLFCPLLVVDEEAIAKERDRLKAEYEEEMQQMKRELEAQKKLGETTAVQAQKQKQLEIEAAKIREEFVAREKKLKVINNKKCCEMLRDVLLISEIAAVFMPEILSSIA